MIYFLYKFILFNKFTIKKMIKESYLDINDEIIKFANELK